MTPPVHGRPDPPRPDTSPRRRRLLLAACWAGHEPAESLDPADRDQLLTELWRLGWTDTEIAAHTRMSTYTTGRIRGRLDASRSDIPHDLQHATDQPRQHHPHDCPHSYPTCCPHTCPQGHPHREMTGGICRCCIDHMHPTHPTTRSEGAA